MEGGRLADREIECSFLLRRNQRCRNTMIYKVQARLKSDTAAEFLRKLTDGTIENQRPEGHEILASMQRAIIGEDDIVRWSEKCYCPTPLQHERETVYDHHFTDFKAEEVEDYVEFDGRPFMEFLKDEAEK